MNWNILAFDHLEYAMELVCYLHFTLMNLFAAAFYMYIGVLGQL